jgi:platelet-activating factor acetylhydrolase
MVYRWQDEKKATDGIRLRHEQLEIRLAEITALLRHIETLDNFGRVDDNALQGTKGCPKAFDWSLWRDRLDCGDMVIAGHSFGAASAIEAITSNPHTPFKRAVLLDPWVDPLDLKKTTEIPTLIVNSQAFSDWSSHASRVKGWASKCPQAWLTTISESHTLPIPCCILKCY